MAPMEPMETHKLPPKTQPLHRLPTNSPKPRNQQVLNQEDLKSKDQKKDNKKLKNRVQGRRSKMDRDLLSSKMLMLELL